METPGGGAAGTFQGRAEERDDDVEHLPPLLEDEVGKTKTVNINWDVCVEDRGTAEQPVAMSLRLRAPNACLNSSFQVKSALFHTDSCSASTISCT